MADVIAQVVKDEYARPYGTWVHVSGEQYRKWGPRGAGQLRAPSKGVPPGAKIIDLREAPADTTKLEERYNATPTAVALAIKGNKVSLLSGMEGSGPLGRIYKRDVEALIRDD